MSIHRSTFPLLASLVLAPFAAAGVLVVDRSNPSAYSEIQHAVNAAVDGDTILVKPSPPYSFLAVNVADKALTIVGDSPTTLVAVRALRVHDLAPGKTVVLSRIAANPSSIGFAPPAPAFWFDNDQGSVRLVDCTANGASWYATPGLSIEGGAGTTAWSRCRFTGGDGAYGDETDGGDAGLGMRLADSIAASYDSQIVGGIGGTVDIGSLAGDGGLGAQLVRTLFPTVLVASNTSIAGGRGGTDADCLIMPQIGGAGGNGLELGPSTVVTRLAVTTDGGAGGPCGCPGGSIGPAGAALVNAGTLIDYAQSRVSLAMPTVAREGQTVAMTITGSPGDRVFLVQGARTTFERMFGGVLVVRPRNPLLLPVVSLPGDVLVNSVELGTLGSTGTLSVPYVVPPVELAQGARNLWFQVFADHASGGRTLGSFSVLTALDASY